MHFDYVDRTKFATKSKCESEFEKVPGHLRLSPSLSLATNRRESTRQQSKCCTKNRPTATNRRRLAN